MIRINSTDFRETVDTARKNLNFGRNAKVDKERVLTGHENSGLMMGLPLRQQK